MPVNYPQVHPQDVKNFARAWDMKGIKMILDSTSLQFATDFANTALRSYVDQLIENAQKVKAAKAQAAGQTTATPTDAVAATPITPSAPQKGSIILTD